MRMNTAFMTSFGTFRDKEFLITEAMDSEGNHGYGESVAFTIPWYTEESLKTTIHVIEDFLLPLLKENTIEHPDDVSTIFQPIKRNNMAKAALEGAIWDLYAKRKKITLAEALGGEKNQIDVGISIGIQSSIDELIETIKS